MLLVIANGHEKDKMAIRDISKGNIFANWKRIPVINGTRKVSCKYLF